MATLKAVYDQETGAVPLLIRSHDELSSLVDKISAYSANNPCASIVEFANADDPYGFPHLYVGIGKNTGFVQEYWNPARSTVGDASATGKIAPNTQEILASQVVSLNTVRTVLAAYLTHGGIIPEDFAELHPVDAE